MDDDRRAAETGSGDGICVECGSPIPRELLVTQADAFRCAQCRASYTGEGEPDGAGRLRKTA